MKAESFITKGIFFAKADKNVLKYLINGNLRSKGFILGEPNPRFYPYLEMNFNLEIRDNPSLMEKIFKIKKNYRKKYFKRLKECRNDFPWTVRVYIHPGKFEEEEGCYIEIISEPSIFYKIIQLNRRINICEEDYSFIIYTNQQFINGIASSLNFIVIKNPSVLSQYINNYCIEELKNFKFDKIAKLLEEGRKKLEGGGNAIGDLIGIIENFLEELIKRIGERPKGLHNPEKNIQKLKDSGFLEDYMEGSLMKGIYNAVYLPLKDKDHKKEQIDLFNLKLFYGVIENYILYLIERILKFRIKK